MGAIGWQSIAQARARLAREKGTLVRDWGGRLPIALIYPNRYHIGMSSLGFQLVYRLMNSGFQTLTERAFLESPTQTIVSLESQRPLSDFAALAFSLSFELDYFNLVVALRQAGIPLFAQERDERHPLVMAGGPAVTANPEPVAPLLDLLVIGEGEAVLPALLDELWAAVGEPRPVQLERLARLPGVYVPTVQQGPVLRQWAADLDAWPASSMIFTRDTEFGEAMLLEVARGCGRGCRFCLAGFCFLPWRERGLDCLLAEAGAAVGKVKRVGLVGAAVSDYSDIDDLATSLRSMGYGITVSSLRADSLSETLLRALVESGTRTLTLAPETGSQRLRWAINKALSDHDLLEAAGAAARWHIPQLKLYFMVGLPTETEEEAADIVRLALSMKERLERSSSGTGVVVSLAPFVPKAQTPFEREEMLPLPAISRRIETVKQGLWRRGIEVRAESPQWAEVQGVLARGDRRLAAVLAATGAPSLPGWRRALRQAGLDPTEYLGRRSPNAPLPWQVVRSGVAPSYLSAESQLSREGRLTGPCPGASCERCGVCQPELVAKRGRA